MRERILTSSAIVARERDNTPQLPSKYIHVTPSCTGLTLRRVEFVGPSRWRLDCDYSHGYSLLMEKVSKSVLKAKMLEYFRKVEESGEELIVTDNRRPVLKIVPIRTRVPAAEAFHDVRGKLVYLADLLEPESDEWPET